jgi:transcriptional regulator with XRE-family HTH domain
MPNDVGVAIGARLKEERGRLDLSQSDFGELGGVKKLTQIAYEQGGRVPDARYLVALAEQGVDIAYVLLGTRTNEYVARLDKNIILAVATAILQWLETTEREVTPQLMADVLTILYDAAARHLDEEHLADQLRAVT